MLLKDTKGSKSNLRHEVQWLLCTYSLEISSYLFNCKEPKGANAKQTTTISTHAHINFVEQLLAIQTSIYFQCWSIIL